MKSDIDERLTKVLEYLCVKDSEKNKFRVKKSFVSEKRIKRRLRNILGIDKQCFYCSKYKFNYELTLLRETKNYVCQDCVERLINDGENI